MKTLLLIDANSIIHRSFHALPPLTTSEGKPIQAIYGLASILLKLWREDKPDYAAALFDRPEPTFRDEKYAEYKAQRPKAPDELISQIIEARNLFPRFGIKTFEKAGYEADDLIATLAENFRGTKELKIVILTGDRDTLQLVQGEKVVVRTFNKGVSDTTIYDEKTVKEKYGGLEPSQLVDYKALVGDPSDNIKGVPGIGPKTAIDILRRFGTLEKAYENAATDPVIRKKLVPFEKNAELAKSLVILERKVPLEPISLENLSVPEYEMEVKRYFEKFGFQTLINRLEAGSETNAAPKKEKKKNTQQSIF